MNCKFSRVPACNRYALYQQELGKNNDKMSQRCGSPGQRVSGKAGQHKQVRYI